MRLVCFSDTHGRHGDIKIPEGDVLIFAGDFTPGTDFKRETLESFLRWFELLPHKYKILIGGNHDRVLERIDTSLLSSIHYLEDSSISIDGIKFYGSPWTPKFFNWAFMLPRDGVEIRRKWRAIPQNTDVLITHGPPYSVLDYSKGAGSIGCRDLYGHIRDLNLKAHIFGHIHEGYGRRNNSYNVSICGKRYDNPLNKPTVIDL